MSSSLFYSQAGNFISSVQGGVDPRTGLFNISLPLANLHSCRQAGPALSLSLQYSPLSSVNEGFGKGFSLNLTRYDKDSGKLVLSTGEEYRVSSSGDTVKQKKLKNFVFQKINYSTCRIIHKSGLSETLSLHKSVYVPTHITAPDGRGLTLTWSSAYTPARLTRITDDDGTVMCTVSYPDETLATTQFSLLPYDGNFGYKVFFKFTREQLVRITSHASVPALVWSFDYDDVGPQSNYRVITSLASPTGRAEKVAYYSDSGMKFPDIANLPDLPCVFHHTFIPGGGQPQSITQWEWTQNNYLGRGAGLNQWQPDTDSMLNILLSDFQYGSTAKIMGADGETVLNSVTRRYNSYHLQVSESSFRDGKTYALTTEYYAKPGITFNDQPAQYALPVSQTKSWNDGTGASPRTRVTLTQFDEAGNPLHQEAPDGTITAFGYYPAEGEGDACPADPHGFTRWLKSKTVTPYQTRGDEPTTTTVCTWKKMNALSGDSYAVMADTVTQTTDSVRVVVIHEYYDDVKDRLAYAREKIRSAILTPDVSKNESFTHSRAFTYDAGTGISGLRQTDTFTGHDGLTATRATIRHAYIGLLLSETDEQDVTIIHSYDKTGRMLSRTIAPGTDYENTATWAYTIENGQPAITETDASGNQQKTRVDGSGRPVSQQRLDADDTQRWFEVSSRSYGVMAEMVTGTGNDWLTSTGEKYTVGMTASYDGWGAVHLLAFSDSTESVQNIDPVGLTHTTYMQGKNNGNALRSVTRITNYDARSHLPLEEIRRGASGLELVCTREWDGLGRLRLETDEAGNKTERTYDVFGRVLTQALPDGSIVMRSYAPHLTGNQVSSIRVTGKNQNSETQTWVLGTQAFDSLGRVTERVSGGRTTTYAYNGASRMPTSVKLPSGKRLTYTYIPELGDRVSSLTTDDVMQTFHYDSLTGDLLAAREGGTENSKVWTPSGSLKAEAFMQEDTTRTSAYNRTLAGGPVTYTDISGKKTAYERDIHGRVVAITDEMLKASLTYDALGRLSLQAVTDNATNATLVTALEYDDFGREIIRTVTDSNGATLTVAQTWSKNDLLIRRSTTLGGVSVREEQYTYDVRNRLSKYDATGSSLPLDAEGHAMTAQRYEYDALNNLYVVETVSPDGHDDRATYSYENPTDPTQLTSVSSNLRPGSIVLKYDANGCMTQDEAGRTLDYDAIGRLVSVSGKGISGVTYAYDALNRLVCQNVSSGDTRQLYYRAGELVNEVMKQQSRETRLIKAGRTCLGVSDGSSVTMAAGDHHDSLVWSRETTQKEGIQHVWSPYGNGTTTDGLPGFNGERADPVSGAYHLGNGYRAYNPVLMRFNCPDSLSPFGAGGINLYAYCAGDPVNHTDPTGHISWQGILGIVSGAMGLALSVFTAGASIAAAGGVMAALGAASTTSLAVGGLGVISDATAIASGAEADFHPQASAILGWVSIATGLAGMSAGMMAGGRLKLSAIDDLGPEYRLRGPGKSSASRQVAGREPGAAARGAGPGVINLHPANAKPTEYYKLFFIEDTDFTGKSLSEHSASGFISNVRGTGQPGIVIHGLPNKTMRLGESSGKIFWDTDDLYEYVNEVFSIDLKTVGGADKPLHLLACYGGGERSIAQRLANTLGRDVIGYGNNEAILAADRGMLGNPLKKIYSEDGEYELLPVTYTPRRFNK